MKIANGLAGSASAKFSSRTMKLLLVLVSTAASEAAALTALRGSKVELTSTHPDYGTKTRIYSNPVLDLLEIAACNEGAIRLTGEAGAFKVRGTIELSNDGAIVPKENEQFNLAVILAAGVTLDVYTIDADNDAVTELEYKPVPCFGATPTPVNVVSAQWLAIDKARLSKLELEMPDSQRITYEPEELEQITSEGNEQAYIANGALTAGSLNLYIINVSAVKTAHVTTDQQANAYVVNEKRIF